MADVPQTPAQAFSCLGSAYAGSNPNELTLAIESILNSKITPDQIVLVIDGTVGNELMEAISTFEPKVTIIKLKQNRGLGLALNAGLKACRNEIICRFDTDDINVNSRMGFLIDFLNRNITIDIVGSHVIEFYPSDSRKVRYNLKMSPQNNTSIKRQLNIRNCINHPSVAFRKSKIESIGSYEDVKYFEDYYLWLKAKKHGLNFANIQKPLVLMRRPSVTTRRSGLSYAINEILFYRKSFMNRLINPLFLPPAFARIAFRLLPNRIQNLQTIFPWRGKSHQCANPDKLSQVDLLKLGLSNDP